MSAPLVSLLVVLLILSAFLRGGFALSLIYLVIGAFAVGSWWGRKALAQVKVQRRFTSHAFLGEKIKINLQVKNTGWLPVPWLEVHDMLPVDLAGPYSFRTATNLGSHAETNFEYSMEALKRGYYPVGPLSVSTGDILGLSESPRTESQLEHVVVYPKIIPFTSIAIPSYSPQGTLRHTLPLFEDPTRIFGKREYSSGDSLRRIDWKSSASAGRLQVRLFEPSIALETFIILNLNADDYYYRSRLDSVELAIIIAASISNWVIGKKQLVGMMVNGRDSLSVGASPPPIPPRKGKLHLMRLLETLARADTVEGSALVPLIQRQRYQLAWGTTLIVITGSADDQLLDELYQARRAGQNAVLILTGRNTAVESISRRASFFNIPVYPIVTEHDLEIWTRETKRV